MTDSSGPTGALTALRASTADLLQGLDSAGWADADLAAPTLCPGWSRGHILTHLARNADGITASLSGALRGEQVARYPGGDAQRDGDIAAGAARPLAVQLDDLRSACARLDRVLGAVDDAGSWDTEAEGLTAQVWVLRRLTEVEVHRVDLDAGYGPRRWPPLLVSELLPETVGRADGAWRIEVTDGSVVPDLVGRTWTTRGADPVGVRGADWELLAWLLGRADRPT